MVGDPIAGRDCSPSSSESSKAARSALTRLVGVSINGDGGDGLLLADAAWEDGEEDMSNNKLNKAVEKIQIPC